MKHYCHGTPCSFLGKIIVAFLIIIMSTTICKAQSGASSGTAN